MLESELDSVSFVVLVLALVLFSVYKGFLGAAVPFVMVLGFS